MSTSMPHGHLKARAAVSDDQSQKGLPLDVVAHACSLRTRWSEEDAELEASLGDTRRLCLKKYKKKEKQGWQDGPVHQGGCRASPSSVSRTRAEGKGEKN